jgi:hypothetical protein
VLDFSVSRLRTFLVGAVAGVAIIGCAAVSSAGPPTVAPTAAPASVTIVPDPTTSAAPATNGDLVAAPGQKIIWGKIWNCGCHDRDGADSVAAELQVANLPSDFKARLAVGQYDYFAISFDPKAVDESRFDEAIKSAGGHLVQGPPAWATE